MDIIDQGIYSAQTAAMPNSIGDNQIQNAVSLARAYIQFDNQ